MARGADARTRLIALAQAPDREVRLAEAVLWIAAEEYVDLDVPAWLDQLDTLAQVATGRMAGRMDVDAVAGTLSQVLAEEQGFRGNTHDYYDPRNSFLNDVLARRVGIPITLSVVYLDVAAAAGLTVHGLGLPGHFIVRIERGQARRLLDPFNGGATVSEADCEALMRRIYGPDIRLDPAHLRPLTNCEILVRMLVNLKGVYLRQQDWARALRAVERITALAPDVPGEIRDRGTLHARSGQIQAAIRDWESYLRAASTAPDADRVRQNLRALRQSLAVRN